MMKSCTHCVHQSPKAAKPAFSNLASQIPVCPPNRSSSFFGPEFPWENKNFPLIFYSSLTKNENIFLEKVLVALRLFRSRIRISRILFTTHTYWLGPTTSLYKIDSEPLAIGSWAIRHYTITWIMNLP